MNHSELTAGEILAVRTQGLVDSLGLAADRRIYTLIFKALESAFFDGMQRGSDNAMQAAKEAMQRVFEARDVDP